MGFLWHGCVTCLTCEKLISVCDHGLYNGIMPLLFPYKKRKVASVNVKPIQVCLLNMPGKTVLIRRLQYKR